MEKKKVMEKRDKIDLTGEVKIGNVQVIYM